MGKLRTNANHSVGGNLEKYDHLSPRKDEALFKNVDIRSPRIVEDRSPSPLTKEIRATFGKTRNRLNLSVAVPNHAATADKKARQGMHPNSNMPALALMSLDRMPPVLKNF